MCFRENFCSYPYFRICICPEHLLVTVSHPPTLTNLTLQGHLPNRVPNMATFLLHLEDGRLWDGTIWTEEDGRINRLHRSEGYVRVS